MKAEAEYLFEASWEVCNKVGGIYTVIKSKAKLMKENYPNYFLVGPYFQDKAMLELKEEDPPEILKEIFNELGNEGIHCHYGTWQIKGDPKTILIDFQGHLVHQDFIKGELWRLHKVDSLKSDSWFTNPVVWAWCVGKLIEKFGQKNGGKKIVGHFHEWLSGAAILYLKNAKSHVKTVFTTHATMLGRAIAGAGRDLYNELKNMNPEKEAYASGVQDKFLLERACAKTADVFTTVSEITSMEAEKILGRKADILVLNGLDSELFPTFEEASLLHQKNREKIREFIRYYFYPHYSFDIEQSLTFFIVGRYEFKNKGIDIFIKALQKLNERLKNENSNKTIIVFFWIPRDVFKVSQPLIDHKITYREILDFVRENESRISSQIADRIMCYNPESPNIIKEFSSTIFTKDFLKEAKRLRIKFKCPGVPGLLTHDISDKEHDPILQSLYQAGLDNQEDDKVKVIYYPVYLTPADGLLNLSYYDALSGCHFGVFPSYYEPWGYTPLESAALGVPSLTTDLAGFGRFLMKNAVVQQGIFVLRRMGKPEDEVVDEFFKILYQYMQLNRNQRVQQKIAAKQLSTLADWNNFIDYYIEAHNMALKK
ncbi:hypothetical protein D6745_02180 [Candidatus Woesearchaeota archaeon]|nr:MAG: hypothetical protein D6745_02180 [Candidatus Woesearchaeota archaeon]